MMHDGQWLVEPRTAAWLGGSPWRPGRRGIVIGEPALAGALRRLAATADASVGAGWEVRAASGPGDTPVVAVRVTGDTTLPSEGYRLTIDSAGARVEARDLAGARYGIETVKDAVIAWGAVVPALRVEDAPALPVRGFMLDVSRTKVPTGDALRHLVDLMARLRLNHLELYTEHTFQYVGHRVAWEGSGALSGDEVMALGAYCRDRGIDLVPNQNTLGHLRRWLVLPPYRDLAETHGVMHFPWGDMPGPFSLSPAHPGSLALVQDLLDQLLPHFSSPWANIGLDEAYDVGQGQSRAMCAERGRGAVLVDYLCRVADIVHAHGKRPLFWADMLTRHHTADIQSVPADAVALEWGYEPDHDFVAPLRLLKAAGLTAYACPGTNSWISFTGRAHAAAGNLANAARAAAAEGADGYLITDWGDLGHFQPLPVSYPGLHLGAALAWNPHLEPGPGLEATLGTHLLGDPTGEAGRLLWEYGRLHYTIDGQDADNSARVVRALLSGRAADIPAASLATLADRYREAVEALDARLAQAALTGPDSAGLRREMRHAGQGDVLAARFARAAASGDPAGADRALLADLDAWTAEHRDLWLRRNRPEGLDESVAFLQSARRRLGAVEAP
jgi:hexosaminidase